MTSRAPARRRRTLIALFSAAIWFAALPAPALAEPDGVGSIGISVIEDAASPVDERSRMYIVDHLSPGDELHREIEVQNASPERQHVELYSVAASVEDEVFTAAEGRGGNDLSDWTTLDQSSVDLGPGQHARVGVTIEVPETASRGERYAAVFAEVAHNDGTVREVNRVGIRTYLSVGPGGELPADFAIDDLAVTVPSGAEWPVLTARVRNTGERALDMSGSVSLQRDGGTMSAGPFDVATGVTILPGGSGHVQAVLDEPLPSGEWDAEAVLASGDVERTAEATIVIPGPAKVEQSSYAGRIPLAVGILAAAIVVAFLLGRHLRSRVR
jgi:hypothetical protein